MIPADHATKHPGTSMDKLLDADEGTHRRHHYAAPGAIVLGCCVVLSAAIHLLSLAR